MKISEVVSTELKDYLERTAAKYQEASTEKEPEKYVAPVKAEKKEKKEINNDNKEGNGLYSFGGVSSTSPPMGVGRNIIIW